uniref:Serine carboxypeptidase n=1 Tax=Globodera pallida TaxID=36090 RepID=A0A183CQH8_GLOPA
MEHRFYGEDKMPTIKFDSIESLAHLDVIEALEDIRSVVDDVAQKLAIWGQTPINRTVVVGADYAGALALWLNLQKDKMPPKITWAASPSPLLLISLGHENKSLAAIPSFDQHLTELMANFGCDEKSLRAIFQWMDETAREEGQNGQNGGLDIVTGVLHYFNGIREKDKDPIETVKEMALLWLRKFASERNTANFVEEKAKLVWPLEELCESVSKASDGKAKATAFGQFIVLNEPTAKMGQIDYRMALDGSADKDRWTAKMFQQCTQMPLQICASGGPKDAFYKQCPGGEKQRLTERCEQELAAIGFNETERQLINWDFVADTFGFDLNSVRNLIITFDQFDPLAMINLLDPTNSNKTADQIPFRSDSSRHFYVFPSIGLSTRAREMDAPNSCDPMALNQARTQIIDILQCLVYPDKCLFKSDQWPFPMAEQDRQSFASNHSSECQKRLWHYYPWASYNGNSEDAPNSPAGSDVTGRGRDVGWTFWMGIVAMLAMAIQIYK